MPSFLQSVVVVQALSGVSLPYKDYLRSVQFAKLSVRSCSDNHVESLCVLLELLGSPVEDVVS